MAPIYPKLRPELLVQLRAITPVIVGKVEYYPCSVVDGAGKVFESAYFVEQRGYHSQWGRWPEINNAEQFLPAEAISRISESPKRLPQPFAQRIYDAGESAMGAFYFDVTFKNGEIISYLTGSTVDFLGFPVGLTNKDISDIHIHSRFGKTLNVELPKTYWILFEHQNSNQENPE